MMIIIIAMSFLALYANVQKLRRAKIEEVQARPQPAASLKPEAR
jgi:hypothetical protein